MEVMRVQEEQDQKELQEAAAENSVLVQDSYYEAQKAVEGLKDGAPLDAQQAAATSLDGEV